MIKKLVILLLFGVVFSAAQQARMMNYKQMRTMHKPGFQQTYPQMQKFTQQPKYTQQYTPYTAPYSQYYYQPAFKQSYQQTPYITRK